MSTSSRKKDRKRRRAIARRDAAGRVHLALLRDPKTGAEKLTLLAPVFKEAWQNELTLGAANTARSTLGAEPELESAVALARHAMAATSQLAEGLLARAPEGTVACKVGCDHCCYEVVGVTPPEALAILLYVKRTRSAAELAELTAHVAELDAKGRGLSSSERFSPEHPCVFLRGGKCTIYESRPLACRGMNSLDAGECERRLHDPETRAKFVATGLGSHSYLEPIRAFHAVSAGIQLGLAELYNLDMRPLELTAAMHLLLTGPSSLGDDWIAGGSPFEPALAGDKSGDPGMRELSGALAPKL